MMAGRPREFDRDTALNDARDLFWRCGYEGTSMSSLVATLGIASARIYKAFGSKEQLFREAVAHYEENEGGFAERALREPDITHAISRLLEDAVLLYTAQPLHLGCMVVSSTSGLSDGNQSLAEWLSQQRNQRTQGIIDRFRRAAQEGQLSADASADLLGNYFATVLHGLSVQARDGVSRNDLSQVIALSLRLLETARSVPDR